MVSPRIYKATYGLFETETGYPLDDSDDEQVFSVHELARRAGVYPEQMRQMIARGAIKVRACGLHRWASDNEKSTEFYWCSFEEIAASRDRR